MQRNTESKDLNTFFASNDAHEMAEECLDRVQPARGWCQPVHARKLRRILALLDEAIVIKDIDAPGFHLRQLKGNMKDVWAVTVQANWRVIFRFSDGDAHIVGYQDGH